MSTSDNVIIINDDWFLEKIEQNVPFCKENFYYCHKPCKNSHIGGSGNCLECRIKLPNEVREKTRFLLNF